MPYERELEAALAAAEKAADVILTEYATFTAIPDAHASISTQADKDSQETILKFLQAIFPDDAYVAEEDTPSLRGGAGTSGRSWVVDPIDGTRGFAQKNGEFSVMVGLIDGEDIVVGVVLEPVSWRVTYAVRGGGCWKRDGRGGEAVRCQVTATADPAEATLVQSRTKGRPWPHQVAIAPAAVVETHSAGVKLARVARGEADLYVNHYRNFHDWDICAGQILVEEAGGRVTTFAGRAVRYGRAHADQRDGLLASNGALHEAALGRLKGSF